MMERNLLVGMRKAVRSDEVDSMNFQSAKPPRFFTNSIFMGKLVSTMVDSLENLKQHRRMSDMIKRKVRLKSC